jgi:hypothetical protein
MAVLAAVVVAVRVALVQILVALEIPHQQVHLKVITVAEILILLQTMLLLVEVVLGLLVLIHLEQMAAVVVAAHHLP